MVRTSKRMFYPAYKPVGNMQRNHTPVSHPQTTAKANNSRPQATNTAGAPPKEGELRCYECGQKGHIKPQCPKLKGKQRVARAQIEELIEEDEELSELPIDGAPNDALNNTTYPQEGEEDLKNNSGDNEEEKSHYEWDEPEYKANFVRFINEETHH